MLESGIRLTLMIGPAVPVPVPKEVLDALTSVEVQIGSGQTTSGFELKFLLSARSPLHTLFLLSGGSSIPMVRVVIVVTINGISVVIMDGVVTHHQVTPSDDKGQATLTVFGKDLLAVMSYVDFSGIPYPAMPRFARVAAIVAKYAVVGIVPLAIPSVMVDIPSPTNRIPKQKGDDLAYIRQLAREVGYVFYLDPGPEPGTSVAYWGPEIRIGSPQPALNINMDAHTNVESLDFSYDVEKAELPIVYVWNEATHAVIPIPIPDITPLSPPLGLVPPIPKRIRPIYVTADASAKYSTLRAALIGMAKAAQSMQAVSATGTLDVLRYGRLLRPRKLVGVRGAGTAFDGLYYVTNVTHSIQRGQYKQSFGLMRNGLISTVSRVSA